MPGLQRAASTHLSAAAFSPLFELELDGARLLRSGSGRGGSGRFQDPLHCSSWTDLQQAALPPSAVADLPADSADLLDRVVALSRHRSVLEAQLAQLAHEAASARPPCSADGGVDIEAVARTLLAAGYLVQLRDGCSSDKAAKDARSCLRNLRHRFLVCIGLRASSGDVSYLPVPLVVDPRFREQFTVAHPTPEYDSVLKVRPGGA